MTTQFTPDERFFDERTVAEVVARSYRTTEWATVHVAQVRAAAIMLGAHIDARDSRYYGRSAEEIVAAVEKSQRRSKRRAGVRALQAKYGYEGADQIANKYGFAGKLQR